MVCWLGYIISFISGGLAGTFAARYFFIKDRKIQFLILKTTHQEVKSILPIVVNGQTYQNIIYKKMILINKTNQDQPQIDIVFAFDKNSKLVSHCCTSKVFGKNCYKNTVRSINEIVFHITNFNRKKEITFEFEIGDIVEGKISVYVDNICSVEIRHITKFEVVQSKIPQTKIVSKIELEK